MALVVFFVAGWYAGNWQAARRHSDTLEALRQELGRAEQDYRTALGEREHALEEARRVAQQSSKLASIGEFAAGLAHEINNPLDGIMSCLSRLERDPANLAQNMAYLRLIQDAIKRMAASMQQLLAYAHRNEPRIEPMDIHESLEHALALIGPAARQKAIAIEYDFEPGVPLVLGDRQYLTQAFMNIAMNALNAIMEAHAAGGGQIIFRTVVLESPEGGPGQVGVEIEDNGPGIAPEVADRVFEPFFTTKGIGEGTGLGLTIVRGIIEEHRGSIRIESSPNAGTTVRVSLPAAPGKDSRE